MSEENQPEQEEQEEVEREETLSDLEISTERTEDVRGGKSSPDLD